MLTIRLRRTGTKNRPCYRIVVSESKKTPQARVVDIVGHYDPTVTPRRVEIDVARCDTWISKGAQPSDTVRDFIRKERARAKATA
jgi:small subunit ribosomal protein S16